MQDAKFLFPRAAQHNMETTQAVAALAALAQDNRLDAFRASGSGRPARHVCRPAEALGSPQKR
jgi:hypothetical protein